MPVVTGNEKLLPYVTRFQKDCVRFLSEGQCKLPYKITLDFFPAKKYPDRRGYAEMWGRGKTTHWVDVRIADYLQSSIWRDALLVTTYHELFHAWFNLDHDNTGLGIMNSVAYNDVDTLIVEDFDYYLGKEFDRVKHK